MNQFRIEKVLWGRLKILGYVLIGFSVLFLGYALFIRFHKEPIDPATKQALTSECIIEEDDYLAEETLNFFLISAIFASLGVTCLLSAKRRHKKKSQHKRKD